MIKPILSNQVWLSLKTETKLELRRLFDIPRSGHVEVFDGKIFTDGVMIEDLQHLTVEKMQTYLKSESTDFYELFNNVVSKIEGEVVVIPEKVISGIAIAPDLKEILKARGRPRKIQTNATETKEGEQDKGAVSSGIEGEAGLRQEA